jgi:hypothetical protein
MAKQTFTTGQVLTAAQMTSLQQTAMGGGSATAKTASYTLVAADAGTTVIMNSGSSTTITVNTALFAAGDTVLIVNQGAGVCTITAGSATVDTAGSLALAQYETGQLYFLSTSAAIFSEYTQAAGGGMTLISTTALTGSSVTLSSISGSYKQLKVVVKNVYGSAADWVTIRCNGDTGSNYSRRLSTVAGTTNAAGTTVQTSHFMTQCPTSSDVAKNAMAVADLYDYTTTTGGQLIVSAGSGFDSANLFGAWNNGVYFKSAAITSLTIGVVSGTFSGGTVLLYGVS